MPQGFSEARGVGTASAKTEPSVFKMIESILREIGDAHSQLKALENTIEPILVSSTAPENAKPKALNFPNSPLMVQLASVHSAVRELFDSISFVRDRVGI